MTKVIMLEEVVALVLLGTIVFATSLIGSPTGCSGQWINCKNALVSDNRYSVAFVKTTMTNRTGVWAYGPSVPDNSAINSVIVSMEGFIKKGDGYMVVQVGNGATYGPAHVLNGSENAAERTTLMDVTNEFAWTPNNLKNLGVMVSCFRPAGGSARCYIDSLAVQVSYTLGACTPNWQCTSWSACVNGVQTRTCTDTNACGTNAGKPAESQSCIINQTCPTCLSPSAWSTCANGTQARTNYRCDATTNYACQAYTQSQSCATNQTNQTCTPSWTCTSWSACANGTQTRTCTDANNCGNSSTKPAEIQDCAAINYGQCCPSTIDISSWGPTPNQDPDTQRSIQDSIYSNYSVIKAGQYFMPTTGGYLAKVDLYIARMWLSNTTNGLIGGNLPVKIRQDSESGPVIASVLLNISNLPVDGHLIKVAPTTVVFTPRPYLEAGRTYFIFIEYDPSWVGINSPGYYISWDMEPDTVPGISANYRITNSVWANSSSYAGYSYDKEFKTYMSNSACTNCSYCNTCTRCIPSWTCGDWSTCVNGVQDRTCTDVNNCGSGENQHLYPFSQYCNVVGCTPLWTCGNWSVCLNNIQTRTCTDALNCGNSSTKPVETQNCTTASIPAGQVIRLTNNSEYQIEPKIYGNYVVYVDYRNYPETDIYAYDLASSKETRISGPDYQWSPEIFGTKVVYEEARPCTIAGYASTCRNINMYDFSTGQTSAVSSRNNNQITPKIYQNKVVWWEPSPYAIYLKDLSTGNERRIIENGYYPSIYGDIVVFMPVNSVSGGLRQIGIHNITSNVTFFINKNSTSGFPKIHREMVVYQDYRFGGWNIFAYNLTPGTEMAITTRAGNSERSFDIYGSIITYSDTRNVDSDIYWYDLSTGLEKLVERNMAYEGENDVYENIIVFSSNRYVNPDIFVYITRT